MDGEFVALVRHHLADPGAGWSMGASGAIAEFVRDPDEPVRLSEVSALTARGGIRLALPAGARAVAYETPVGPHGHWNHAVALCVTDGGPARTVVTELGPDADALDPADRDTELFDLGLGRPEVDACVRTADPELVAALRAGCGRPLGSDLSMRIVAAGPVRVFTTPAGRVEVRTPIPQPDGRSPDGPHTHLLPHLLGRGPAATVPVPPGFLPCGHLYPASPLTDRYGRPRPFDAAALAAFEELLDRHGDPDQQALADAVRAAVRAGRPHDVPTARTPPGRAAVAVALRKLARTDPAARRPHLPADPADLDPDGDRNAG